MAIISFPVERVTGIIESNDYSNLKNFIAICDDNRTLEFYAGIAEENFSECGYTIESTEGECE